MNKELLNNHHFTSITKKHQPNGLENNKVVTSCVYLPQ